MQPVLNSSYPRNMTYIAKRLLGFSRQTVRLQSIANQSATSSSVIRFELPSNTIVDMDTLAMYYNASVLNSAGAVQTTSFYPRNFDQAIIRRLEVEVGGKVITGSCDNYNLLANCLLDFSAGIDKNNQRAISNGGIHHLATVVPIDTTGKTPFATQNFLGLNSMQPRYLNTSLTGPVRITIYLAPDAILLGGASYLLEDIMFSVDVIDISDGHFQNMLMMHLQKGGVYEVLYKNYFSFANSVTSLTQTTSFNVSSQSVNKIIAFMRTTINSLPSAADGIAIGQNAYLVRNAGATTGIDTWQFSINGVMYPAFSPSGAQAYPLLANVFGSAQDLLGGITPFCRNMTHFKTKFWACAVQLDHDDSSFISGLNTIGNSASCYFTTSSSEAGPFTSVMAHVYVECSSVLQVGAGRQVNVIW